MMAPVNAAEFYATVRREVGPGLKACGFRRSSRDIGLVVYPRAGLWIKPLTGPGPPPAPDRLIVSFDHSRWGWLPTSGGEFRVHLEVGGCANILQLLDEDQRSQLIDLEGAIISRIRHQPYTDRHVLSMMEDSVKDPRVIGFMPYWDDNDIVSYTTLLVPWLPGFAVRLGADPARHDHPTCANSPVLTAARTVCAWCAITGCGLDGATPSVHPGGDWPGAQGSVQPA